MLFNTHRGVRVRRAVAATLALMMVLGSTGGYGRGRAGGGAAGALDDFDLLLQETLQREGQSGSE